MEIDKTFHTILNTFSKSKTIIPFISIIASIALCDYSAAAKVLTIILPSCCNPYPELP